MTVTPCTIVMVVISFVFGLMDILTTQKRSKIVATRHVSEAQNYKNCGRRSALDPAGEAYSAPQTH